MSELGRTEGRHLGVCAVRAPCSWEEGSDSQWAVIVRICSLWLLQPSSSPGPASDPRNLPSQFWRPEVWGSGVQGTVPTQAPGYGPPSLLQLLESWKVHGGPELSHPSSLCVCAGMSLLCARFGFTPTPTRLHSLALGVRQVSQCRLVLGFSRFLRVSTLLVLADYAPSYLPASVASALCQQPRLCGFWAQALTWSLVCTTLFPSWLPGPGDPALAGASDPGPGGGWLLCFLRVWGIFGCMQRGEDFWGCPRKGWAPRLQQLQEGEPWPHFLPVQFSFQIPQNISAELLWFFAWRRE